MLINNGNVGELDLKLFNELTAIHYGRERRYTQLDIQS
ncbi:MAG: hypothetical protein KatS3mg036_0864 [Ignavibacterium sp.]|nr:MAG: hypothetical protein KatS3mg036_0864 [Ignavibacterium sp.]